MAESAFEARIHAVRRFNRFYTRQIGLLQDGLLASPFSLSEVRVLYELAHRERPTAGELAKDLGLDAGYLSRILRDFGRRGLVEKRPSDADRRQSFLSLTKHGAKVFAPLDRRSHDEIAALLEKLGPHDQARLTKALATVETLLGAKPEGKTPYLLRQHRPGDMGWVIGRHGALYADEHGWDESFEALVAEIAAKFIRRYDAKRERCWIAEVDGENVGSVFLVKQSRTVAKLRLLIVEPRARGLGIGRRLVEECIRFARQAGYRKLVLWTNSVLLAARSIYVEAGFRLVREEPHRSFGRDLVGETWELTL
jgi:DNA-binding MarR family transcriptional regulator/N-acetylglutamate synthase-like GNAT family acetyltransferase